MSAEWVRGPKGGCEAIPGEEVRYITCSDDKCPDLPELNALGSTGHAHLYIKAVSP
jgi:hypothetical protein